MMKQMRMVEVNGEMKVETNGYKEVVVFIDDNLSSYDIDYGEIVNIVNKDDFSFNSYIKLDGRDGYNENLTKLIYKRAECMHEDIPLLIFTNMPCMLELTQTWDTDREKHLTYFLGTDGWVWPAQALTDRELREGHNLYKIYINGDLDV